VNLSFQIVFVFQKSENKRTGIMGHVVDHLPRQLKASSANPSTAKVKMAANIITIGEYGL
jgi:RNase P/RNase MRP subunit p29